MRNMGRDGKMLKAFTDTASDGQEALDKFTAYCDTENPYVLIFMDISMEPMDGFTATIQIKNLCEQKGI